MAVMPDSLSWLQLVSAAAHAEERLRIPPTPISVTKLHCQRRDPHMAFGAV